MNETIVSKDFKSAILDYLYLSEKDYPQKAVLKIVSDKYRLNTLQRSILLRGIYTKKTALVRKNKFVDPAYIKNKNLAIDCYNVLITISNYLTGNFVYIANDGLLRDALESHGKLNDNKFIEKSLEYCLMFLKILNADYVSFYVDSPISHSGDFAKHIEDSLIKCGINSDVNVVKSADHCLINNNHDVVCTSDSVIIDRINFVFDLPFNIISYYFKPDFFYIEKIIDLLE